MYLNKYSVTKNELTFSNYKNIILNKSNLSVTQNTFRSHKHQLYTETITKVALSGNDDKVYISNNNIDTYNFGHYKIRK